MVARPKERKKEIIIQNVKSIKELRQCVHNNLQRSFIFPISVGSVPVSVLFDRSSPPLKWESQKTCEWWEIDRLTLSIFKSYIHNKDIQIIIQNAKTIKELRQCVHNNLRSSLRFPILVGSVPVSSLFDRSSHPLKWESHKTCKWWDILVS